MTASGGSDDLVVSLERALASAPDDVVLRLHLAQLLVDLGRRDEAITHIAAVLQREPGSQAARAAMARAIGVPPAAETPEAETRPDPDGDPAAVPGPFDWNLAEDDLGPVVPPMFAHHDPGLPDTVSDDLVTDQITLADVGGLKQVKKRLDAAFLAPMRNEKLRSLYGKSLRGGLLLYGPPGCGKTFIARALAGEMGASFLSVSIADVLDMYVGRSEQNVHDLFEAARRRAPCVIFLDEVDAIGHKRSNLTSDSIRTTVNQLLLELDSAAADNDGVFVLAATNHPWDVDPALRRPGRLDRTLLVLPPDLEARVAIWQRHLVGRPIAGIDVKRLAKATAGFSGADIAHACESAAELALLDAVETGEARMIGPADIDLALRDVRSSVGPWLESARNVALFANQDGTYDELLTYLRKRR